MCCSLQWNDDFYFMIEQVFGAENTRLAAQAQTAAIDFIERVCKVRCSSRLLPPRSCRHLGVDRGVHLGVHLGVDIHKKGFCKDAGKLLDK